jgi:hypothetical protein
MTGRPTGTCIYFLLKAGESSHWHRVDATEIWLYHAGAPLILSLAETEAGPATDHLLTPDLTQGAPQIIVPEHHWQAARTTGDYTLVSCTVSPGSGSTASRWPRKVSIFQGPSAASRPDFRPPPTGAATPVVPGALVGRPRNTRAAR